MLGLFTGLALAVERVIHLAIKQVNFIRRLNLSTAITVAGFDIDIARKRYVSELQATWVATNQEF